MLIYHLMQARSKYRIAILGATGNVGRLLLDIVHERNFPFESLKLLASPRSVGTVMESHGRQYKVELAEASAFDNVDIVLASAGSAVSEKLAPEITKRGAVLIDNSSFFRMHDNVPLVVPEVNAHDIAKHQGIIANPNCTTAPLVVVLKALDDNYGVKRVIVSTYQSVSGAGKEAMDELRATSAQALKGEDFTNKVMNQKIAFNVIPQIDKFTDNGYTKEEMKVVHESRKILGKPDLRVTCTAVRVPVEICHSESVNVELDKPATVAELKSLIAKTPAVVLHDDPSQLIYPMPLDVAGKDPVYVGRVRADESNPNTFNMWIVSDNLRIGAALNTVKIAEALVAQLAAAKV